MVIVKMKPEHGVVTIGSSVIKRVYVYVGTAGVPETPSVMTCGAVDMMTSVLLIVVLGRES